MKKIDISTSKYPSSFAMVDDEDFDWLNQWKWHVEKPKIALYAVRNKNKNPK